MDAFKKIIFGNKPISLYSDQDATFTSHEFTSMLKENNIIYNINTLNDHISLSVIDVFTKKSKLALTTHILETRIIGLINCLYFYGIIIQWDIVQLTISHLTKYIFQRITQMYSILIPRKKEEHSIIGLGYW